MRSLISLVTLYLLAPAALADDTPAAPAPTPPAPIPPATDAKAPEAAPTAPTPAAPTAPTGTPSKLSPIARAKLPPKCQAHARFANAYIETIALSSRLSLAQCLVAPALEPIKSLLDTGDSMMTLETAVAPSLAIYDEVIALGAPQAQLVAAYHKGKLYEELLSRMQNTVPPPGAGETAAALYQSRQSLLAVILQPWRDRAAASYEQVGKLAKANAQLASKHRQLLAHSEQQLAALAAAKPAGEPSSSSTPSTPTTAASPSAPVAAPVPTNELQKPPAESPAPPTQTPAPTPTPAPTTP